MEVAIHASIYKREAYVLFASKKAINVNARKNDTFDSIKRIYVNMTSCLTFKEK